MRSVDDRLHDILTAIGDIERFVGEMDATSFAATPEGDRKTFRAVIACLSDIGEAVKALPDDVRDRHPDINWKGFAGLRDVVAHQYFRLNLHMVWKTISEEMPAIKAAIEAETGES